MKYLSIYLTLRSASHVKCQCDQTSLSSSHTQKEDKLEATENFSQLPRLKIKVELPREIKNLIHGQEQFTSTSLG